MIPALLASVALLALPGPFRFWGYPTLAGGQPITAPSVTSAAASSVTSTGMTLNGTANPNGATTTGWFRYHTSNPGSCADSGGTRAPVASGDALGDGRVTVAFNEPVTGLDPGATYYFCAIASNSRGTGFGSVLNQQTTIIAPTVVTAAASSVGDESMQLNGTADPNGAAATGWFRYYTSDPGTCTDSGGTRAPSASGDSLGAGTSPVAFDETITGLTPGTTYYLCAFASNSEGTGVGAVQTQATTAPNFTFLYPAVTYSECVNSANAYQGSGGQNITGGTASQTCTQSDGDLVAMSAGNPRVQCGTNLSDTTGSACYLYSEADHKNSALNSDAIDNAYWTKDVGLTVTADQGTDGFGATTMELASRLVGGASTTAFYKAITGLTSSTTHVVSLYAKAETGTKVVSIYSDCNSINVSACTCAAYVGSTSVACTPTASSTECYATATVGSSKPTRLVIYPVCASATTTMWVGGTPGTYRVASTSSALFGGVMLEEAKVVEGSYIATAGSTVTRAGDIVFADANATLDTTPSLAFTFTPLSTVGATTHILSLYASSSEFWALRSNSSAQAIYARTSNSVAQTTGALASPTLTVGTERRVAGWVTGGNGFVSVDGTATAGTAFNAHITSNFPVTIGGSSAANSGVSGRFSKICADSDETKCR